MQITFTFANGSTFTWGKEKSQITNPTKKQHRRPANIDIREYPVANAELTQGLYHNSYPGLKLAGSMAYAPIAIPVAFMGLPIPVTDNENQQEEIDTLVLSFSQRMQSIHRQAHREGTIWVWPFYDSRGGLLRWEFIPDESVSDVILDIQTREIIKLIVDEEIYISTGYNEVKTVRRRREFTREKVTIVWSGQYVNGLNNEAYRNPVGILPVPFANNIDGDEHRGYSDYERIVADLKAYAEISEQELKMLAKFQPKMIQYFASSVKEWLDNNGFAELADVDIATTDFIMNSTDTEKTEILFPEVAFQAWEVALKRLFKKIVEGSGIPEILWGVATDGNHASADKDMDTFVMFVGSKQNQHTEKYKELYKASFQLLAMAGKMSQINEFEIKWNHLSAISEKTKAEIFGMFAKGVGDLINVAGITKEQLHNLWVKMYPEETVEKIEDFITGLADMAGHKQFKDASFTEAQGMTDGDLTDDEPENVDIFEPAV